MGHLCVLPWIHLHLENDQLFPCCRSNSYFPGVKIQNNDPLEAFNQDEFIQLREQMLQDQKSPHCRECWAYEEAGITSLRQRSNLHYKEELESIKKSREVKIEKENIKYIASLTSNHCNLACRSCEPKYSSSWNKEAVELDLISKPINYHQEYKYDQYDHCSRFYFVGGEPLLKPSHEKELQAIIDGHQDCSTIELNYSTNLNYPSSILKKFLPYWNKFKTVKVFASLDHTDDKKYHYLRYPGQWKQVEVNYQFINQQPSNIIIGVQPTISLFNIDQLPNMIDYFLEQMNIDPRYILLNPLIYPEYYSATTLPKSFKESIHNNIQKYIKLLLARYEFNEDIISLTKNISAQVKHMMGNDTLNRIDDFYTKTDQLDRKRQQDFSTTFPEIYQALQ